jgi:hypothetical protein
MRAGAPEGSARRAGRHTTIDREEEEGKRTFLYFRSLPILPLSSGTVELVQHELAVVYRNKYRKIRVSTIHLLFPPYTCCFSSSAPQRARLLGLARLACDFHICTRLPNLRGGLTVPSEAKHTVADNNTQ